jgi:hypothetical protein
MQPGLTVNFTKGASKASIGGKYKHIATPMTFNAFEIFPDYQGVLLTDMLLQHLSGDQIREIQTFFGPSENESSCFHDVI